MLNSIISLRLPIRNLIAKYSELSSYYLSTAEFTILANIANILALFEKPTIKLQGSKYPTLFYSLPYYLSLKKDLVAYKEKDFVTKEPILLEAIISAITKLDKYLEIDIEKEELLFSIILDPRRKLSAFKHLGYSNSKIEEIKLVFIEVYNRYILLNPFTNIFILIIKIELRIL